MAAQQPSRMSLHKDRDARLGATIAVVGDAVVIVSIKQEGFLAEWNARNPLASVREGDTVVEVNGQTEPWAISRELTKVGCSEVVVQRSAGKAGLEWCVPSDAGSTWAQLGAAVSRLFATKVSHAEPVETDYGLCRFPIARAGDVGADTCAICIDGIEPDERIAHLACGHGFHQSCMAQWVQRGKSRACPLCKQEAISKEGVCCSSFGHKPIGAQSSSVPE